MGCPYLESFESGIWGAVKTNNKCNHPNHPNKSNKFVERLPSSFCNQKDFMNCPFFKNEQTTAKATDTCPYCKKILPKIEKKIDRCPYCGKYL